jgi:formamidopyrimidine-DNA glycosylase
MDLLSLVWIAILAQFQRYYFIVNETNYCAHFQTSGTVLADRALSPLLKKSWPRTLDEL